MKYSVLWPLAAATFIACAASTTAEPGTDPNAPSGPPIPTPDNTTFGSDAGAADSPFASCASASFEAKQSPASLLVVLDASGTMAKANKYVYAKQALLEAIDQDAFNTTSLGLLLYPTGEVPGPDCIAGFPVLCKVASDPQVPLSLAGTSKSTSTSGVRAAIRAQLEASSPTPGFGDGNPSYDALRIGLAKLKSYKTDGKRILLYITDGGASCASLSAPTRPGYVDVMGCYDWEQPDSVVSLLRGGHDDASAPVNSFVVGVPGADGQGTNPNTQPPYHVRNALSAYAFAGSPETVDPTCTGRTFSKTGADPQVPCHFDMTQGYSPQKLTAAIDTIRGHLLGCEFDVPAPAGEYVDKNAVNVEYTTATGSGAPYRRQDPKNNCAAEGCWDYTPTGKVQLIGKACETVKTAPDAKVKIVVGCQTILR